MEDFNGREIHIGDIVQHAMAKDIVDWGPLPASWPRRKDGTVPLCPPFQNTAGVVDFASSRCVRLTPNCASIPVFLACMLEVVQPGAS